MMHVVFGYDVWKDDGRLFLIVSLGSQVIQGDNSFAIMSIHELKMLLAS